MKKLFSVRTVILAGSLLLQLNTLCFHSRGAAGDVDLSFDPGSGVNGTVNAVAVQPDGKVIIGGQFTTVKGLARSGIARLNADGSGDATFNAGTWIDGYVTAIALQPDGKVIFTRGSTVFFGTGPGFSYTVVRLNSDGTLDNSFTPNAGSYQYGSGLASVALQPDGKLVLGGYFIEYYVDGESFIYYYHHALLIRLNANGTSDTNFTTLSGDNDSWIQSVALQADGKMLVGSSAGIARLNANGTSDGSFNPGGGNGSLVALQSDGKVLVSSSSGIARLNPNGSLDNSFNLILSPGSFLSAIAVQPGGKVLIGGYFTNVNGTNRRGIARLNANGTLDGSFDPGTGVSTVGGTPVGIRAFVVQSDGKVLIGGLFSTVNGTNRERMARLNADGSLDNGFYPGAAGAVQSAISSLVVQPDGKVLVGGPFTFINGTNHYASARLNMDGSRDIAFVSDGFLPDLTDFYGTAYEVAAIAVQSDGKVLVSGLALLACADGEEGCQPLFSSFVTRLNPDGSRDTGFTPFVGPCELAPEQTAQVQAVAVQPDGKVVVGYVGYGPVNGIVRLNTNGIRDTNFYTSLSYPGVYSVVLQADGKLLVGGSFTTVNGTNRNELARLNSNGSLDNTFNPAVGGYPIALQPDGKILVGGYNADGSLDSSFNPGTGPDGIVRSIALQSDGKVLIGGDFTTVNGVVRPHVARLYGDFSPPPSLNIARSNAFVIVSWTVTGSNFQLQETTNIGFPNSWFPTPQATVTDVGQISVIVPASVGQKFFRLKSQ